MFQSYFKIAGRNLSRYKGFSFINIAGLAIGMACSILIFLFVGDELSYDRIHEKANRIYRIGQKGNIGDRKFNGSTTQAPVARTLVEEFPEVEAATRIQPGINTVITYEEKSFFESRYLYVDSSFFNVFTFPLVRGNPKTALSKPYTMVLTESTAKKYFGDEDPIGKILHEADGNDFMVTGVAQDVPENSHFHFDVLASIKSLPRSEEENWLSDYLYTYIVLKEGYSSATFETKLPAFIKRHMGPQLSEGLGITFDDWAASGNSLNYYLDPLTKIYLHSEATHQIEPIGDITYVYFFSIIAFFILLLACINFTNLTSAKSSIRAREVGMRKVMGSSRGKLIMQFLAESTFLTTIALLFSLVIVELLLPLFCDLSGKALSINYLTNWYVLPVFLLLIIGVGLLSGSYSAFMISSFQILTVIRGEVNNGAKKVWFRSGLVIFQYTISIVIIICTIVVYQQLEFIRNKKLGFIKDHVLVIDRAYGLAEKVTVFKEEILKHHGVLNGSITSSIPGMSDWSGTVFQREDSPAEELFHFRLLQGDYEVLNTFGYELVEGRFFSKKFLSDSMAFVINETAVKDLGFKNPVGQKIIEVTEGGEERMTHQVIGVVKDFHFNSLREPIENLVIYLPRHYFPRYMSFRIESKKTKEALKHAEKTWKNMLPNQPFRYFFLEDNFNALHQTEQRTGKIFAVFSILAIFIASLGLLGLASFMAEQRTKEIGIRKVLGASVPEIVRLFSKEFILWGLIANLIAWPVAYFIMKSWLQGFAYRVNMPYGAFFTAALVALFFAIITVSVQTIHAATRNPVKAISYE